MLVDSHCHLDRVDLGPYQGSFPALLSETRAAGIEHMLCVCIDLEHYEGMRTLVGDHEDISFSVGVHPNEADRREPTVDELVGLADDPRIVAIGETGLDYHYNEGDLDWQRARFRVHIEAAKVCGKPLIIHTRDAREDTIAIMRDAGADAAGGVMHCFTETLEMAEQALELGFYISFSGIITFKNAESLRDVARRVPLDRLLIETDSPYLAPVPHRGKKNEPRFVAHVAELVAELRGLETEALAEITAENFFRLFKHARRPD
ncbi:MAG: TatD family hydrolase [Thiohalocapsa sp.]|nr:TatD family hydrolase [Thiohalocapsa sp.]MCF7991087.1 TatD family hydrolase [Thiohalocapsa sp.]